jgi:hypothetical protein
MRGDRLFRQASSIINGERQDQYGNPEDSFKNIGELWGWYLGVTITPEMVAFMMALFKAVREKHQRKRDNVVDMAGYLAIYDELTSKGDEK